MVFRTLADAVPMLERLSRPHAARALSFMDRDRSSPTYGAMDRAFWYYRTLTNFPGAIWQQPMVGFAAILAAEQDGLPDAEALRGAASAALSAWTRCQHRSGAFDEWYRNEHSYCPTAITTAGAVVALHLLGEQVEPTVRTQVLNSAERAAGWLAARYNAEVMNQNLAAAVALAGLTQLGGSACWRNRAEALLRRIACDQSSEGYFSEYGGFDFGYSTLALDFLALASEFGLGAVALPMAARLIGFLNDVTTLGAPLPGRLGSRGSSHAFPFGAIRLIQHVPAAANLARRLIALHAAGLASGPGDVDDRYFAYFYFPAFSLAYWAASRSGFLSLPADERQPEAVREYPDSGLAIRQHAQSAIYVSRNLGGALAVVGRGKEPHYHLGYTVAIGRRRYSSAAWQRKIQAQPADNELMLRAAFREVSGGQPLARLSLLFQAVVHLLFTSRIAELFQSLIKRKMIAPKRTVPLVLERRVQWSGERLALFDTLRPHGPLHLDELEVTSQITMHSPSARQDIGTNFTLPAHRAAEAVSLLRAGKAASLSWGELDSAATTDPSKGFVFQTM